MDHIINVKQTVINNQQIETVNARELHDWLNIKTKFADWIKRGISTYDFIENQDYTMLLKFEKCGQNNNLGTHSKEYYVSIDMAKELAMVEPTERGKQARKYFIECERKLKDNMKSLPGNFKEALLLLVEKEEQAEKLALELKQAEEQIVEDKPYTNLGKIMQMTDGSTLLRNYSTMLQNDHSIQIGEKRLFEYMRKFGWLCIDNRPTQKATDMDLFVYAERPIPTNHGVIIKFTPRLTNKGQVYFLDKLIEYFKLAA